jgi:type III pantothenate kinase
MNKLLLIDAGNTRVKWATAVPQGKIQLRGHLPTERVSPRDLTALAREFPEHRAVLASVVPKITSSFKTAFGSRLHLVTGTSHKLPFHFKYPKPEELGADRIAAAVAAYADGKWPAIIVSCGTASAFTVLNRNGELCGGVIAPGLRPQLKALLGATAQLPVTSVERPRQLPAKSTREAIRAGVFLSFQGGVREIVAQLSNSLSGSHPPHLLLTGGDAALLKPVFGAKAELRPLLVFEGLRIMGARIFFPPAS